jgi:hypothetical protein
MATEQQPRESIFDLLAEARKVLDLPEIVNFREIQHAYHEQTRRWHPEQHHGEQHEGSTRHMQQINRAYKILKDYFFQYHISLRREDAQEPWDLETWWKKRFAGSFWQDDDDNA